MENIANKEYVDVISDFFEDYEMGDFSEKPTPVRETHYTEKEINQGPWTDVSVYHTNIKPNINLKWEIIQENKKKVLRQAGTNKMGVVNWKFYIRRYMLNRNIAPIIFYPALVLGDEHWKNYRIKVELTPQSQKDICGVIFRSSTSMRHYIFGLKKGKVYLQKRKENRIGTIAKRKCKYAVGSKIEIIVEVNEEIIEASINDKKVFSVKDSEFRKGKCGIIANIPAIFRSCVVQMKMKDYQNYKNDIRKAQKRYRDVKTQYPEIRLKQKINLPALCSGRSIRFGDLSGQGDTEYLIVRGVHPKLDKDRKISMTAVDSNGKIMWQKGQTGKQKVCLPPDVPVQIYDINNDGRNEVICEYGTSLQILDAKTGDILSQVDGPRNYKEKGPFLHVLDSITICNLSGSDRPQDIIIKDMYSNLFAYDSNLKELWSQRCNTGHYPFTLDINNDGKDEVLIGYNLLNAYGEKLWSLKIKDHADAVAFIKNRKNNEYVVAIAASDEGFVFADARGKIRKQLRIGHMQTITAAKLFPDSDETYVATNTYWGNPGIIYILDLEGNIVNTFQPSTYGSPISPVKWENEKEELILLSAAAGREGGLYNAKGQQVVSFPDDGHPNLCYFVGDIDNDGLDEIICWDHDRLWVYESEAYGKTKNIKVKRLPLPFNQSNYRSNISIFR